MYRRIVDADSMITDVMILEQTGSPIARRILVDQLRDLRDVSNPAATYFASEDLESILAEILLRDAHVSQVINGILAEIVNQPFYSSAQGSGLVSATE